MRCRIWAGVLMLYAGAIFGLSQLPVTVGEPPFHHFDKCLHAAEFALFFVLAWKAADRRISVSFLATAVYAGTDELHQLFVATRTASALDFAADLVGATIALAFVEAVRRLWRFGRRRILSPIDTKVES